MKKLGKNRDFWKEILGKNNKKQSQKNRG